MAQFAYPNATPSKGFIGCGRYLALSADETAPEGYVPEDLNTINLSEVMEAATLLAKESGRAGKQIYRKKDVKDAKYVGDSQDLAYLLAMISSSRPLKLRGLHRDIWCTGTITLSEGIRPMVKPVDPTGFDLKLTGFLSDDNPDNLFIVAISNIRPTHEAIFTKKTKTVNVVTTDQFQHLSIQDISERKTILKVPPFELVNLVNTLFKKASVAGVIAPLLSNPYRGLFAFQEKDAEFFFGRAAYTTQLVEAVQKHPFVAVLGASGSGKSSLVHAGLIPQLRRHGTWLTTSFRPGEHPFYALSSALIPFLEPNLKEIDLMVEIKKLTENLQSGQLHVQDVLQRIHNKHPAARLLIFADQFEELYTLCQNDHERCRFLDGLLQISNIFNTVKVSLILTMRADFLGKALAYRPFAHGLQGSSIMLGPMNNEELRETIEKPAERLGTEIEEGLTERILDAVRGEPGNLPFLEFALTELWEKQTDRTLTHAAYNAIGGVEHAVTLHADNEYEKLSPREQVQAQRIFIQLVRPGEGTDDIRRVATRADIDETNWELVSKLADYPARLVTTTTREESEEIVEIVHEALITGWPRLRAWMVANREFRLWQDRLRAGMPRSETTSYDEGVLLRGTSLAAAEEWFNTRRQDISSKEQQFIEISLTARQQSRRRKSIIKIAGYAVTVIVIMLLYGLWQKTEQQVRNVYEEKSKVEEQRQIVLRQKNTVEAQRHIIEQTSIEALSVSAKALFLSRDELGAMLAMTKAGIMLQHAEVPHELRELVIANFQEIIETIHEKNRLEAHTAPVITAALSSDSAILASGGADGTIIVWNAADGSPINTFQGHSEHVLSVDFSPDNSLLASAGFDGAIRVWNVANGRLLNTLQEHAGVVYEVAFSPDGLLLASAHEESIVTLWNIADGSKIRILSGHADTVSCVRFSPDGNLLASGSDDGAIRVWNVADGRLLNTLQEHAGGVYEVAFSPDGLLLASAHEESIVTLWNVADGSKIRILSGHGGFVSSIHFSPDGMLLASGSGDRLIRLWAIENGTILTIFQGHSDAIYQVGFSPDGKRLVSASWDKTIRVWELHQTIPPSLLLDELLRTGCTWIHDYLTTNPNVNQTDRILCDDILYEPAE